MVDYVVTYVNNKDPEWQKRFTKRLHGLDVKSNNRRFRDMNTILYALRGVETHMSWIRKVFFIVQDEGQIPEWVNRACPKLQIVFHKDFIPEEFLPTFNSNVIEMFIHRIEGLSDNFILANDDMIPVKDMPEEYYFADGKPVLKREIVSSDYHLQNSSIFKNILFNNTTLIMKYRNADERIQLKHFHLLVPYSKPFWEKVFNTFEREIYHALRNSPLRTRKNINHWFISDLQALTKDVAVINNGLNTRGYIGLSDKSLKNDVLVGIHRANVICLNDKVANNGSVIHTAIELLEENLPNKSSFEV